MRAGGDSGTPSVDPGAARGPHRRAAAERARRRRPRRGRGPRLPPQRARGAPARGRPARPRRRARGPRPAAAHPPGPGRAARRSGLSLRPHPRPRRRLRAAARRPPAPTCTSATPPGSTSASGPRYAELVGYHLEQAHRWHAELRPERSRPSAARSRTQAAERLAAAGQAALQRGDLPGRREPPRATAALLPTDAPARAPVLPELAPRARPARRAAPGRSAAQPRRSAIARQRGRRARRGPRPHRAVLRPRPARARCGARRRSRRRFDALRPHVHRGVGRPRSRAAVPRAGARALARRTHRAGRRGLEARRAPLAHGR